MKLAEFTGGLNTRLADHLIGPQFARTFTNVNYKSGELKPVQNRTLAPNAANINKFSYYFEAEEKWVSKTIQTSFVEFQERLYMTDGVQPKKRWNDNEYNLGIAAPSVQPNLVAQNGPEKIVRCDLVGEAGAGELPRGETYTYVFVNKDSVTGLNSGRSNLFTVTLTGTQDSVRLTNVGAAFATSTDAYRLYQGTYYKVGTFTESTGSVQDNDYDISELDSLDDVDLLFVNGTVQYALVFVNTIDGSKSKPLITEEIEVANGRITLSNIPVSGDPQVDKVEIYRIGGNITLFTLAATIDNGTTTYIDELGDTELPGTLLDSANWGAPPNTIKYLTEYKAMLFAADNDKLRFTPIGIPNAWPETYYLDFPSTITGLAVTGSGLLVFTKYKTWVVLGSRPEELSQFIRSGDQGCSNHFTVIIRGNSAVWVSEEGVCVSNGLKVEVLTKNRLDKLTLSTVNAALFDQVYSVQLTDGRIFFIDFAYEVFGYKDLNTEYVVTALGYLHGYEDGVLYRLESSTGTLGFDYTSPKFIANGLTYEKYYNNFLIYAKGLLIITVEIDDEVALEKNINSTTFKTHELRLAKAATKGSKIQVSITGVGTVQEYRFAEDSNSGDT